MRFVFGCEVSQIQSVPINMHEYESAESFGFFFFFAHFLR